MSLLIAGMESTLTGKVMSSDKYTCIIECTKTKILTTVYLAGFNYDDLPDFNGKEIQVEGCAYFCDGIIYTYAEVITDLETSKVFKGSLPTGRQQLQ